MLFEKDGKRDSDTEWRIYYLEWHLTVFLTTIIDPSLSLQDDAFRSPSLWRFPFPITSDALSFNRHSERRQECFVKKTKNGTVTQSEESITLNDILPLSSSRVQILRYRFKMTPFVLHHYDASRSPSLVTPFPSIVILNGGKNAVRERRETG